MPSPSRAAHSGIAVGRRGRRASAKDPGMSTDPAGLFALAPAFLAAYLLVALVSPPLPRRWAGAAC